MEKMNRSRRRANEFSEGGIPFEYLSDKAKENAIENLRSSDDLAEMASMSADEDIESLKYSLDSIGVELRDYNIGYPGEYVSIRINDRTEDDLLYPDARTNHLEDIPQAEDDGYFIGVGVKEDWDKHIPELQAMVDDINAKLDASDPNAEYPYYDGFEKDSGDLYDAYYDAAKECADTAIRDANDGYEAIFDDEYIMKFIEGNDILFDEDGNLM